MLDLCPNSFRWCLETVAFHARFGYTQATKIVLIECHRRIKKGKVSGFQAGLGKSNITANSFDCSFGNV